MEKLRSSPTSPCVMGRPRIISQRFHPCKDPPNPEPNGPKEDIPSGEDRGDGPTGESPGGEEGGQCVCTCGGAAGELEGLRAELKRALYRARVLEKHRDEARRERDEAEEGVEGLQKKLSREKRELRESERARRGLKDQLRGRVDEIRDLEEGMRSLRASLAAEGRAREAAEGEGERLRGALEGCEARMAAMQGALDDGRRIRLIVDNQIARWEATRNATGDRGDDPQTPSATSTSEQDSQLQDEQTAWRMVVGQLPQEPIVVGG